MLPRGRVREATAAAPAHVRQDAAGGGSGASALVLRPATPQRTDLRLRSSNPSSSQFWCTQRNGAAELPAPRGPMLRLLRNSSRVQDWSARSRLLARTFVVEPRRLLEIDRNGPVASV